MKSFGKIIMGILIVLLLLCLGSGFFLWYSSGGRRVRKLVHNSVQMKKSAERLTRLRMKEKFTQPTDGRISEDRLKIYIAVCKSIKPTVESYLKWVDAHQGRHGSLQDAVDGVKKTGGLFNLLGAKLEQGGMGPSEFTWTGETILREHGAKELHGIIQGEQMVGALEKCSHYPELTKAHRRYLDTRITDFKNRLRKEKKLAASPNAALLKKYADELNRYALDEKSFEIIKGFLRGRGPRGPVVVSKTFGRAKAGKEGKS